MSATTQGGDAYSGVGRIRVSSEFVNLQISEPYLVIDLTRAAVERGQKSQIVGTIRRNKPFTGVATVTLKRLPRGITQTEPASLTPQDTQLTIPIQAAPDALAGLYKDITCEVTLTENGQQLHQQTGAGILRIDAR